MQFSKLLLAAVLGVSALAVQAKGDSWAQWGPTNQDTQMGLIVRAGYTIGGTSPLPLPPEVRSINAFQPKGGATIGVDGYKMFNRRWGLNLGWHFFYEGFHTEADVKNYRMSLTMDGNTLSGYFTGTDVTNTDMWGMTFPLSVTFAISPRWSVSAGPYFSTYFHQDFSGQVYDNKDGVGYLRVDTPTGEKINMDRNNPATYDFTDHMMQWNGGVEICFDWKAMKHMNVFGKVDWGLSNIWESDFEAVAFKMYPLYATFGVAYRY